MQTDPVLYADQMNLYAYVGNDPLNATDPSGMLTRPPDEDARAVNEQGSELRIDGLATYSGPEPHNGEILPEGTLSVTVEGVYVGTLAGIVHPPARAVPGIGGSISGGIYIHNSHEPGGDDFGLVGSVSGRFGAEGGVSLNLGVEPGPLTAGQSDIASLSTPWGGLQGEFGQSGLNFDSANFNVRGFSATVGPRLGASVGRQVEGRLSLNPTQSPANRETPESVFGYSSPCGRSGGGPPPCR